MANLNQKQQNLVNLIKNNSGLNTHQLAGLRGDYQTYESSLRNRLFTLSRKGLIRFEEKLGRSGHYVTERRWFAVN